ncbi:LytTR family DNA-binding domain-containing protein [Breznakiella homolactica]|uniref:LytTR family transcriptional regulator DNA-binding domain-containing protein n=1 Tax=Breznakiella homolactica TaxID=2798577 RepID=A0A7T7XNL5_9SPIR|nr:LytTR family DNA-binding domain-containing protein [Breznakiella homolactica]QQO09608.1 LytTR family transcriptional regulator DNA-binding domain-containing protein [Breznakiella homolactica]
MTIKLEQCPLQKDIEIIIKYPEKNKTVEHIVSLLKRVEVRIDCYSEDTLKRLNISDIYYIESVDNKTFVYGEKENYQTKLRLYQLKEKLADYDFIQISKYCILNINKLDKLKPLLNRRMEATLFNGIHLLITRKYYDDIKRKLQEDA